MVETAIIADEIRKHIAEGMITDTALIAVVAHLADLFPDLTIAQVSAAMREAIADAPTVGNRKRQSYDAGWHASAFLCHRRRDRTADPIYNFPYRTSVKLADDTLLRLAERSNIVGVKDSSGSIAQSLELLAIRPSSFSVLTGEDALYFAMLCDGADGGNLASAHLATERFVKIAASSRPTNFMPRA